MILTPANASTPNIDRHFPWRANMTFSFILVAAMVAKRLKVAPQQERPCCATTARVVSRFFPNCACRTPCVFNETLNCFLLTIRIMTMMMTMIMMTMTITMTVVRTNNRQVSREGHWQLPLHAKLEDEEAVEIIHDDDEPTEAFLGCLELRAACARMKKEEYNSVGDDDDDYDNDEKSSRSHSKSSSLICWSTPKKLRNSTPVVWMCCTRG